MVDFSLMLSNLESMGFYTFVLPWVLFLVIIYSIVIKAPFLGAVGGQKKQISVIIAAILSFFIVNYEWQGRFVGDYMTELFGSMSLYMAGFLVLILFLGMGGWGLNSLFGGKWIPIVLVLVAIMLFYNTGAAAEFNIDEETSTWLFMLFLVGGALWFLQQEPEKKKTETPTTPEAAPKKEQEQKPTKEQPPAPELTPEDTKKFEKAERLAQKLIALDASKFSDEEKKKFAAAVQAESSIADKLKIVESYAKKYGVS